MQKASLIGAMILSVILPGAGLLLVQKGGWFFCYLALFALGCVLMFFLGLGILIIIPVWFISFSHTFFAVKKYNKLVSVS